MTWTSQNPDPGQNCSFNVTPIIDIVFLLIIFFLFVFGFIESENLNIDLPDNCDQAQNLQAQSPQLCLSVIKSDDKSCQFAVNDQIISTENPPQLSQQLTKMINARLQHIPLDNRTVTLRIDKNIPYYQAQYALQAVAESIASDIKIAAFKDSREY